MEQKTNIGHRVFKWSMRVVYALTFAVIYYLLFSFFFDTPIEYELKKSTNKLQSQYDKLNSRFDSLRMVYDNISERDKSVYKILFESEPYSEKNNAAQNALVAQGLSALSNHELGERFDRSLSRISQQIVGQDIRMDILKQRISRSADKVNRTPSIQPIDNKNLTLLTASYGNLIHPFYKTSHLHRGVDYSVPVGTAVFATADGVVERIESKAQSSGLTLVIKHSAQYKTLYANLDKVLIAPGSKVMRGDIIAFSGNSGLSFAPHLHYEVQQNGKAVNPLPFFFAELDIRQNDKMRSVASAGMQSLD